MSVMNTNEQPSQAPSMQGPSVMNTQESPEMESEEVMPEDDGMNDDEYASSIVKNLEEHLNNIPDQQKEFLAEYATTPEVATVLGIVNGKEVYDYFMRFVDPSKQVTVQKVQKGPAQPGQQMPPAGGQPQAQPSAAPQGQPQAAPQAGVMNM